MKRTKIICTIGPSSETSKTLEAMIKAGMNAARLNMSHGDYDWHIKAVQAIRKASKTMNEPVALILDLQGPKVRVGKLQVESYKLEVGERVIFTTGQGTGKKIPIDYPNLHKEIKKSQRILLADGLMECVVEKVKDKDIMAKVIVGGNLISHKGINLPDTAVGLKTLTLKDKKDIIFGVKQNIDYIALSFARSDRDVKELRRLIKKAERMNSINPSPLWGEGRVRGGSKEKAPIQIIVKIEKGEAVKNFNEILAATDGVMIARGDLALEINSADVPLVQKELIEKCRQAGKPVIVATEMLASMEKSPRPTRAEISDVANAVIDHTDGTMLSAESANGQYPVETVATMARIIKETENSRFDDVILDNKFLSQTTKEDAMATLASAVSRRIKAKAILVGTLTGESARFISRVRSELPILAGSPDQRVVNQLNLVWGVCPILLPKFKSTKELKQKLLVLAREKLKLRKKDKVVVLSSDKMSAPHKQNLVDLEEI